MSRKGPPTGDMVGIRLDANTMAALDGTRGEVSRSAYAEELVRAGLGQPLPPGLKDARKLIVLFKATAGKQLREAVKAVFGKQHDD